MELNESDRLAAERLRSAASLIRYLESEIKDLSPLASYFLQLAVIQLRDDAELMDGSADATVSGSAHPKD